MPVSAAWALFCRNPYAPLRDPDGYGFADADRIALHGTGFPRLHDLRLAALAAAQAHGNASSSSGDAIFRRTCGMRNARSRWSSRRALRMAKPIVPGLRQHCLADELAPGQVICLDASQRHAMLRMLTSTHPVHTMTAGPG